MEWKQDHLSFLELKPVNTSESEEIRLSGGKQRELLNVSGLSLVSQGISDTISPPSKDGTNSKIQTKPVRKSENPTMQKKEKESVTVESPHVPSPMISNDKLNLCSPNIRDLRLSETLEAGLIGNGKAFSNFSKAQLRVISKQLWYPIETDLQGSDLSCSNGSLTITESDSWFSIRRLEVRNPSFVKTSCPLSTCFPVGLTAQDDTRKKKLNKRLKKKPKPTKEVKPRRLCQFVVTKKIENTVYGRPCGNVCLKDEEFCHKHGESKEQEFEKYWSFTCEAIIKKCGTGLSEECSRKGLRCGEFCGENEKYCRVHRKTATKVKNPILRCMKVRARPTFEQKQILKKWFGDKRKTYNLMVEERLETQFKNEVRIVNKNELEAVYKNKYVTNAEEYLTQTPKDIRSNAIEEYFTGVANAFNLYLRKVETQEWKKKNWEGFKPRAIKHPVMKFKMKRKQQCITIPSRNSEIQLQTKPKAKYLQRAIKIYPQYLTQPIALDRRVKWNKTLDRILDTGILYDFKLLKTKTNKYYFCLPYSATIEPNNSTMQAACDGGVRNFQTVYSPQGELEQYGHNADKIVRRYQNCISKLRYRYFYGPFKGDDRLRKTRFRMQEKLKNMVSDLHYKTANTLCKKYNTVILPHYAVASMIRSNKINPNTKRETLALSHGAFRSRMISKAEMQSCKLIIPPNEFQTTMMCGLCFIENRNVKDSQVFHCKECELKAGRDVNAPRNIFIRQFIS
jgi:transposase